jgi:hypothetical protein
MINKQRWDQDLRQSALGKMSKTVDLMSQVGTCILASSYTGPDQPKVVLETSGKDQLVGNVSKTEGWG